MTRHIALCGECETVPCCCWDKPIHDAVNHPSHYRQHPSGVEAITITEHMTFNLGNAIKYIWRADLKSPNPVEDLRKAAWYIEREIARVSARG